MKSLGLAVAVMTLVSCVSTGEVEDPNSGAADDLEYREEVADITDSFLEVPPREPTEAETEAREANWYGGGGRQYRMICAAGGAPTILGFVGGGALTALSAAQLADLAAAGGGLGAIAAGTTAGASTTAAGVAVASVGSVAVILGVGVFVLYEAEQSRRATAECQVKMVRAIVRNAMTAARSFAMSLADRDVLNNLLLRRVYRSTLDTTGHLECKPLTFSSLYRQGEFTLEEPATHCAYASGQIRMTTVSIKSSCEAKVGTSASAIGYLCLDRDQSTGFTLTGRGTLGLPPLGSYGNSHLVGLNSGAAQINFVTEDNENLVVNAFGSVRASLPYVARMVP